MVKLTLINTPNQKYVSNPDVSHDASFPIGILSIASYIKSKGHDVSYRDSNYNCDSIDEIVDFVNVSNSEYIGMNVILPNTRVVLDIAKRIKEYNGAKIVLGGPATSLITETLIGNDSIDNLILGEGEYSLEDLIKGKRYSQIPGLVYKTQNGIIQNLNQRITNLDDLPLLDTSFIDNRMINQNKEMFLITSRGCPNSCIYCSSPVIWDKKLTYHSPERIIEDIKHYENNFDFSNIHFLDDTFTINKKRLSGFLEQYVENNFDKKYTWQCLSRTDSLEEKIISQMAESGCKQISFGIESASPRVLKEIKKGISLERSKDVFEECRNNGIKIKAFFMIGFPDESKSEIYQTLDYACNCGVDDIVINIVKPYPGTELYSRMENIGSQYWEMPEDNIKTISKSKNSLIEQKILKYNSHPIESCSRELSSSELQGLIQETYGRFYNGK